MTSGHDRGQRGQLVIVAAHAESNHLDNFIISCLDLIFIL